MTLGLNIVLELSFGRGEIKRWFRTGQTFSVNVDSKNIGFVGRMPSLLKLLNSACK